MGHFLSYILIRWFIFPFQILPYKACLFMGRLLVTILHPLTGRVRRVALENIQHAFPEKDAGWHKQLLKKHFRYLGHLMAISLYGARLNDAWFEKYLVYDGDSKAIETAALSGDHGAVLNCAHLGIWEILVQYTGRILKGGGIYKPMSNRFFDAYYKKIRETSGLQLFRVDETSAVVKYLKQGGPVGFVSDQNAGKAGIFVEFMHRPAATFRGPVLMAFLAKARLLFYTAVEREDGKILVKIEDYGMVSKDGFKDREDAIRHYTELWVKSLEKQIREYPEQYFWVHRRWKTQPEDIT